MDKSYYVNILNSVDFAIAEHEMVYDEHGNPVDYRYLYVNQPFCKLMSRNMEEILGQLAYEIFPGVEKTWIKKYHEVVLTGNPISFTNYTKEVDRYFNVYAYRSGQDKFVTSFRDISSYFRDLQDNSMKVDVMSNMVATTKAASFEFDLKAKHFEYSPVLTDIIGMDIITYEDYVNLFSDYMHPADRDRFSERMKVLFSGEVDNIGMEVRFLHRKRDEFVWLSFYVFVDERYRSVPIKIRGLVKDIDQQKEQEASVEAMERLFTETRKVANIATFYYSFELNQFHPSRELDEFTGVDHMIDLDQFRHIVHPEDIDNYDYSTNEIVNNPSGMVSNYRMYRGDDLRYVQSSIFAQFDDDGEINGVFGILKDITELERSKLEIEYFANHDVLTGLYNRNNYERYSKKLEKVDKMCIFICDVDGLKLINDAFGHQEGDKLLVHLADILRDAAGEENVYRIGGDEFVITILDACDDRIREIERRIRDEVSRFRVYGVGFDVSLGWAMKEEGESLEDAFRQAENIMYRRKLTERKSRKSTALNTIMQTMHERTEETEDHCYRVGEYAVELLKSTGRKRDYELEDIRLIADVHDIGKISVSDAILGKPGRLTDDEFEKIKYHSESGYKIISNIIDNEDIAIAVLYHHERYDGKGYPHGLAGEDIPLYSRIISICDAYDAMTTRRVYSEPKTKKQAIKELKSNAGSQFDPVLVDSFIEILKGW